MTGHVVLILSQECIVITVHGLSYINKLKDNTIILSKLCNEMFVLILGGGGSHHDC